MAASPPEPVKARTQLQFLPTYRGPNPLSAEPVVRALLELDSAAIASGPERCRAMAGEAADWFAPAPALLENCDTAQGIGQFLAQWALAALNKEAGCLAEAGVSPGKDGKLTLWTGFHHENLSGRALTLAAQFFDSALEEPAEARAKLLATFWNACLLCHPDYQLAFLIEAARVAQIPYAPVSLPRRYWRFGQGQRSEIFHESGSQEDSSIGIKLARDKSAAKVLLGRLGIPTPPFMVPTGEADLPLVEGQIGWPCVVKPNDGGRSVGVTMGVDSLAKLTSAIEHALASHDGLPMVEAQVPGEVFRIMVLRGTAHCVIRRGVPIITGDGTSTIRQLVEQANQASEPARAAAPYLGPIPLDEECEAQLATLGLALDSVPDKAATVPLRQVPLLSTGAIYEDVTSRTHRDTLAMAELAASAFGIVNCGVDFISRDITRPPQEEGAVLEVNATPGLRVPLVAGRDPLETARAALGPRPGRVPASLLIVPADWLPRMGEAVRFEQGAGWVVGHESGVGPLRLGGEGKSQRAPSLARHALRLVHNPSVGRIVVIAAARDIYAEGLPLDRFDRIATSGFRLDPEWRPVLERAAGEFREAAEAKEALEFVLGK